MYERVLVEARKPWAITPEYGAIVRDVLQFRLSGQRWSDAEIAARVEAVTGEKMAARQAPKAPAGNIAVIPMYGVISHRSFEASSGCTSVDYLSACLKSVVNNDSIGTIVLDVASPGGSVTGVPELAAQIYAARRSKYIVAACNGLMCSAAYWLSSQANEIVTIPSGLVGSVGVYALSIDESEWLAKAGVKINSMSAGEYKLEGASWMPLSDEGRAHMQEQVNVAYNDFLSAVAKGRGTNVTAVKKNYGQGRVFDADAARAAGMVDRIETFDATLARLAGAAKPAAAPMAAGRAAVAVASAPEADDTVQPDETGSCPTGYEMGEDGLCHVDDPTDGDGGEDDAEARARRISLAEGAGRAARLGRA